MFCLIHCPYWISKSTLTEIIEIKCILQSVSFGCQPVTGLSFHATANRTHFTNRAICLNGEGGVAGLWYCSAPAAHAHTNKLRMSAHFCILPSTLWCHVTCLCLCFYNVEQLCVVLLQGGFIVHWFMGIDCTYKTDPVFCPFFSNNVR